jgi:sulfur carrier protein
MRVEVNGEPREIGAGATIGRLLEELGLTGVLVAVEQNREVVPRAEHAGRALADGDRIEIVHFVGGG